MTASLAPAMTPRRPWRRFGARGLVALAMGVAVALALTLATGQALSPTLVHSTAIAIACWLFIDGGRMAAALWQHRRQAGPASGAASQWPGWRWMAVVLPLGTLAGYLLGSSVASHVLGNPAPISGSLDLRSLAALLLLSLVPGVGATYFFYSRGRLATTQAQAELAQRLAAEHRLRLLASQLEPHMLFNTLANLRALIGIDPARAQAMLDRLIPFLRATLAASRASTQTLADEFACLADYLALMQIRMGARLQTHLELPSDLAHHRVPALLLQPLVENAIRHGLEPQVAGGRVDVSAAREGQQLVLRVRDTGAGLASTARAVPASGSGFGLVQVRERLATLHGDSASLVLEAAPDAEDGTLATLRLPLP